MKKILIGYHSFSDSDEIFKEFLNVINYIGKTIKGTQFYEIEVAIPKSVYGMYYDEICQVNISTVYLFEDRYIQFVTREVYFNWLLEICKQYKVEMIFLAASVTGRAIAAWLSVKLQAGVTADVVKINYNAEEDCFIYVRATSSNELLSQISCKSTPQIATLKLLNQYEKLGGKKREEILVECPETINRIAVLRRESCERLPKQNIIIGIGRAVSEALLKKIKVFAKENNLMIMGSKPVIEKGYLNHIYQIGQSGTSIAADLYIAIGISGATQHIIGIIGCNRIVSINCDENAAIHKYADVGLICNAEELFD